VRHLPLLALAAVLACGGRGDDPERDGDRAWVANQPADALAAWRRSGRSPRVLFKRAEAALVTGHLPEAAEHWVQAARVAPERSGEAAAGLVRTARAAERADDVLALRRALIGLREVAPTWPVGRLALRVQVDRDLAAEDVAMLVPAVLATNPGPSVAGAALERLASAERLRGNCLAAVPLYELVARRSERGMSAEAAEELATCEVALGLAEAAADLRESARGWLERAAGRAPDAPAGRRALVALGDLHLLDGDPFAASLAWQSVVAARVAPDSITALALARLRTVPLEPEVPDSVERP
jgi:tetratricopeptide (TPR) repeat protein